MTKVLIDVPDNLHRLIKTIATSKGETMKYFILRAMSVLVNQETKSEINNIDGIDENEADDLLKPYLSALAINIKNGKEEVIDSKEFFDALEKA